MDTVTFGQLAFNRRNGTLTRDGKHVALGGRSSALLTALLDANGSVVSKADLMERVWPGLSVEEGNLTVQMAALRKALGQRADNSDWIVTVARIGYRLWAEDAEQLRESSSPLPSLAVLPFHNLSGDATQDYFADGIVDDLITALSRFKTFAVISRNSSFVYKGRAVDVREIGRELSVRYVLEGSIRRSGSRLRVTAQLVDTATAGHLWAQNYDGALEDVFEMQDRITESVVSIVEPMVKRAEIERTRLKPPTSLDAYDLYLQAMALVLTTEPGATLRAIELIERSLALDPNFPPAIAIATIAHTSLYDRQMPGATEETRRKGLEYARAALAVAGSDANIRVTGGISVIMLGGEYESGLAAIRRRTGNAERDGRHARLTRRPSGARLLGLRMSDLGQKQTFRPSWVTSVYRQKRTFLAPMIGRVIISIARSLPLWHVATTENKGDNDGKAADAASVLWRVRCRMLSSALVGASIEILPVLLVLGGQS